MRIMPSSSPSYLDIWSGRTSITIHLDHHCYDTNATTIATISVPAIDSMIRTIIVGAIVVPVNIDITSVTCYIVTFLFVINIV